MNTKAYYDSPADALADHSILQKQANFVRPADPVSYCQVAAALIKTAHELQDDPENPTVFLYELVRQDPFSEGALKLASIVYQSLGRISRENESLEKLANAGAGGLTAFRSAMQSLFTAGKSAPINLLKTVGLLGALAGGTAGAGTWAIGRGLSHEDQNLRELEIKRDTYRKLTAEVDAELQRRGLKKTPANLAAAVDYLT